MKFMNDSISFPIYKRVLDRKGIYRVKMFNSDRSFSQYLVSNKEVNTKLDTCNENVTFTYSTKLVAMVILES